MAVKKTVCAITAIALGVLVDASAGRAELAYPKARKTMDTALSRQDLYMEGVVLALAALNLTTNSDGRQRGACIIERYFAKNLTGGIVGDLSAEELERKPAVFETMIYFDAECAKPAEVAAEPTPAEATFSDAELLSIFEGVVDTIGLISDLQKLAEPSKCVLDLNYGAQNGRSAFLAAARARPEDSPVVVAFEAMKPCGSILDSNAFAAPMRGLDLKAAGELR